MTRVFQLGKSLKDVGYTSFKTLMELVLTRVIEYLSLGLPPMCFGFPYGCQTGGTWL